jgi:hypothetical protein
VAQVQAAPSNSQSDAASAGQVAAPPLLKQSWFKEKYNLSSLLKK